MRRTEPIIELPDSRGWFVPGMGEPKAEESVWADDDAVHLNRAMRHLQRDRLPRGRRIVQGAGRWRKRTTVSTYRYAFG